MLVFLNKCDMVDDEEMLMLVEEELREMLTKGGFDGEKAPIIHGSALKALSKEMQNTKPRFLNWLTLWIPTSRHQFVI